MPIDLNSDDVSIILKVLEPKFDELRRTMLDLDAFPSSLFSDARARLVNARDKATTALQEWVDREPNEAAKVYSRLPDLFQGPSVSESLLEAVAWSITSERLIHHFDQPARESRVFTAAPQLFTRLDDSGLITITDLDARPWGLHFGEHSFQYHQLLRRGYRSRIHYGLISILLRLTRQHGLIARVALDEHRLQFRDEYLEFHESDYWFGPTLSNVDLDDPSIVGETFHGDPEGGNSILNPYAGLSVRWTVDGELKTVEIEEFMPPDPSSEWIFARYLHAIRDTGQQFFVHCDGAVKAYAADSYPQTQQGFKHRGKGDRYRKLFRLDGQLPADGWSEVACSWFRGNRLIAEYFGDLAH